MKKTILLSAFFLIFAVAASFAQVDKEDMKDARKYKKLERKEISKRRKVKQKALKENAIRKARKEEKRLTKQEGWKIFPGARPMSYMLEESWIKQGETFLDEMGFQEQNAYIWASGNGVARSISAAKMQAIELAKVELAGLFESKIASLTEANIANAQLSTVDAESISEIVRTSKTLVSTTLKRVEPVVILTRDRTSTKKSKMKSKLKEGVVEVQVMLFYDMYQMDAVVKDEIKKNLKDKLKDNEEELKKLMGM